MKKFLTILLVITFLINLPISAIADAQTQYSYIDPDGSVIYYYLDEYGMPYYYQGEERIYLLIPISSCIVTDEALLGELNEKLSNAENEYYSMSRSAPASYYSLMQRSVDLDSNTYIKHMDLANAGNVTNYLRKYPSHPFTRIRTANLIKPNALASKNVNIIVFTFLNDLEIWVSSTISNVNATDILGVGYRFYSNTNYFFVQVTKASSEVNFDLNVWTSPYEGS